MRGYDTHDKRFENFNPEPECSTKAKNTYLPHWMHSDPDQSKTMNFDLPSYCMNMYQYKIDPISVKLDTGSKLSQYP